MEQFSGKGVSGTVAIGKAVRFSHTEQKVRREKAADSDKEIARFTRAQRAAEAELSDIFEQALREVGEGGAQIFAIHRMMLSDADYEGAIVGMIREQMVNAEYAVATASDTFARMFSSMEDTYMKARAADVRDIGNRLLRALSGKEREREHLSEKVIICASDLSPSETVLLPKDKVLAFLTAQGSASSHTAILARSMNIPAIVSLGDSFLEKIKGGETLAVDAEAGTVILSPDEETCRIYEEKRYKEEAWRSRLLALRGKETVTRSGQKISLFANIGSVEEVGDELLGDAEGIGLFRSEFLYLGSEKYPTEEEQFTAYKEVLERMAGKKVIIRTLDIGADKKVDYFRLAEEENPALGLRGIRLSFERPEIFRTQLRALYRAGAYGRLGIMFPMIANAWEVEKILALCTEVKKELRREGIPYAEDVEIGVMIETPAAALISDAIAPLVDFFSVGTNDLTQYTLACDRQNPCLDAYAPSHHAAVLRLIEMAAEAAHRSGAWIGICGELASDTSLTETFLRMGIDELSMAPSKILEVREIVRNIE